MPVPPAGGDPIAARRFADRTVRGDRVEGLVQVVIMLAIGGAAGAASFTHVHNVAASHGQPGWLAWADAIVLELMSIASGLELRRRRRAGASTRFPAVVLGCAVILSLAAQVVEAEPSVIGWTAAAVPALGFLVMVKVALGHTAGRSDPTPSSLDDGVVRAGSRDRPVAVPGRGRADGTGTDRRHAPVRRRSRGPSTDLNHDEVRTLLPAARTVRDRLSAGGEPVTRSALAHHLRASGNSVSNSKVSALLKILRSEREPPPVRQRRDSDQRPLPTDPRQRPDQAADVKSPREGGDTS